VATVMGAWLVKVAGSSEVKMLVLLMITVPCATSHIPLF